MRHQPRTGPRRIAGVAAAALLAAGAATAQSGGGLTLQQVEQRYRGMSPIYIEKCDTDGSGLYDRAALACVQGIYNAMYRDDR